MPSDLKLSWSPAGQLQVTDSVLHALTVKNQTKSSLGCVHKVHTNNWAAYLELGLPLILYYATLWHLKSEALQSKHFKIREIQRVRNSTGAKG